MGPKEDATHSLGELARRTGLSVTPAQHPFAILPDWGGAEGRILPSNDVCQLEDRDFSATVGAVVAIVHVREVNPPYKVLYNRWMWVDRVGGTWRAVFIDTVNHAQREIVPLKLITNMLDPDLTQWPASGYDRTPGAWHRDPSDTFDRVQVMLGKTSFLTTTGKLPH